MKCLGCLQGPGLKLQLEVREEEGGKPRGAWKNHGGGQESNVCPGGEEPSFMSP